MKNKPKNTTNPWRILGITATLVIILSIPLYLAVEKKRGENAVKTNTDVGVAFVGSEKCRDCHRPEYEKWKGSHHERAMAVAGEDTVLGDFDDAVFEHLGHTSRFYRKDGRYFVHTRGAGGKPGEFEITHTFGWYPLQQYLIPFPDGRLQCLPIAWDVEKGRWFHLYPEAPLRPEDWLYWTNNAQNWNGMCAECHSTDLKKNYDPETDAYGTVWSEISVGCEACHGPGSKHMAWAELPEMGRPETENAGLTVKTKMLESQEQVSLCAPCHSRRMSLDDNIHQHADFLDYGIPQLLTEGFYFADGQILDEVYVYGSFTQSKMAARDVKCGDCHDVHSINRVAEGNALCLQCHKAAVYDTRDHHFHKKAGEPGEPIRSADGQILFDVGTGAQCEQCHMPGRYYMGVDYRPDHSFRIPRPDLGEGVGAPNACSRCHQDKSVQWAVDAELKWHGERRRAHYGTLLARGRRQDPGAEEDLVALFQDRLYPDIVRATALFLLGPYPGEKARNAFVEGLADEASLVRHTAVRNFTETDATELVHLMPPLLFDSVKAVRIEAAARLAGLSGQLTGEPKKRYESALAEYIRTMERMGDFAPSRHNLGNLYTRLGNMDRAVMNYEKAIAIDDLFFPAKVNLASLYNQQGRNEEARRLLMEVIAGQPDFSEVKYSLGLLLAEMKKYTEAERYLAQAARGLPKRDRIFYNLALVRQQLRLDDGAESALKTAHDLSPENADYLYALAIFYLQRQRLDAARDMAEKLSALKSHETVGRELLGIVERMEYKKLRR